WGGIVFEPSSHDNVIQNAIIRDGSNGVADDSPAIKNTYNLKMYQTVIKNMLNYGIYGFDGNIYAENCLVFNIGQYGCVQTFNGGTYTFLDCTFADYSNVVINHQNPAVYLSNYYTYPGTNIVWGQQPLNSTITNCIIYGSLNKELVQDNYQQNHTPFQANFSYSCIRVDTVSGAGIIKSDPKFKDYANDNYHLLPESPCKGAGTPISDITVDLDNYSRSGSND